MLAVLCGGLKGASECRTNSCELGADGSGQGLHAGNSSKGEQSYNKSVFNQILAFLTAQHTQQL
jgi:hypothetical protein